MALTDWAYAQGNRADISFSATRDGEFVRTTAQVDLPVTRALVWEVLTDYERYPSFISSMRESKIVSRGSDGLVVDQKGRFKFLFFSQAIQVRLLVSEMPPNVIESRALEGDFTVMDGRYELRQAGPDVRLFYSGRLLPRFGLPPIFGTSVVRHILLANFREMVDEIRRRDAADQAASKVDR